MKKTTSELQKDVNMLEDIIFETSRVLEDEGKEDKSLTAMSEEYAFFLFANKEDEDGNDDNYQHVIESEDAEIRRYFMHTFVSFLVVFFRLYEYLLVERIDNGKTIYTENGNIIKNHRRKNVYGSML